MRRSMLLAAAAHCSAMVRTFAWVVLGATAIAWGHQAAARGFHDLDLHLVSISGVGDRGLAAGDLDSDGSPELIVSAGSLPPAVLVMGTDGTDWSTKQILTSPLGAYSAIPLPLEEGLLLVWDSGHIQRYGGWPLELDASFQTDVYSLHDAIVADVDASGAPSLLIADWNGLRRFNLQTHALEWHIEGEIRSVVAYQLDADPALELGLTTGEVLDGATLLGEWFYPDGFGEFVAAGRVGQSGAPGLLAGYQWSHLTVFQAQPWSPVWDWPLFHMSSVLVSDLDGDGIDEILQGDGQWGALHVIDSQTHAERFAIDHDGHFVGAIATGDFDADGSTQIAFSPLSAFGGTAVTIAEFDGSDARTLLQAYEAGGFHAVAHADVDADGSLEYVFASDAVPSSVRVLDAATRTIEWEMLAESGNANDWNYASFRDVHIAQLDADAALEVVLVGTSHSDGRIVVLDGVSHAVELQIGYYASGPMTSRGITGSRLVYVDADAIPELVVATEAETTGSSGVKLHLFSLTTGATLWESVAMGTGFSDGRGVLAGQFDLDPAPELVAVLPDGFRIYDGATRLLEQIIPAEVELAILDERSDSTVRWVDPDSRLHSMDVATQSLSTPRDLPVGTVSLMAPEGSDQALLVSAQGQLLLTDLEGSPEASSPVLGGRLAAYGQVSSIWTGTGWVLAVGTGNGYMFADLDGPERIHSDGFE